VLAKALEMEQNKNYIQAMLQLGTVQKISPIYDKAQEAIKRIKAQIQKEIDDYKKTGRF
jgi:tRNA(Ser,Leu) C12 N-acetylase TAN1